ncbi:MAG TPA: hypothetical protein VMM56_03940 [Planctomycetaceae bacterium]|nr:hypothetical protein [Planctomycetaceae bacterium]
MLDDPAVLAAGGAVHPEFTEFLFLGFRQLPVVTFLADSLDDRLQTDGAGDRDVQALDETVHRDRQYGVGLFEHRLRHAVFFSADHNRGFLRQGEIRGRAGMVAQSGGDDLKSLSLEICETILGPGVGIPIAVQRQPAGGTEIDLRGRAEIVTVLDQICVLNSERIAASQTG